MIFPFEIEENGEREKKTKEKQISRYDLSVQLCRRWTLFIIQYMMMHNLLRTTFFSFNLFFFLGVVVVVDVIFTAY